MNNMLMTGMGPGPAAGPAMGPQGAMGGQGPQVDSQQIAEARAHMGVVRKGLSDLSRLPKGALSKRDLFNAVGEMIAQGAFATPQAKQQLIAEIAQLPDDEGAIRQALGTHLLRMSQMHDLMGQHFPAEGA